MNTPDHTPSNNAAKPRTHVRAKRWAIAAVLTVAAGAVWAGVAGAGPLLHGHHGHANPAAMSPAAMHEHIGKMVEQCAADASADQKQRLAAIANAAVTDLGPVHEQFRQAHAQAHALLMAPAIDRAALEQWRAAQIQRIDFMSRRAVAAVADGAEVLTPEQRAACGGRLKALMH